MWRESLSAFPQAVSAPIHCCISVTTCTAKGMSANLYKLQYFGSKTLGQFFARDWPSIFGPSLRAQRGLPWCMSRPLYARTLATQLSLVRTCDTNQNVEYDVDSVLLKDEILCSYKLHVAVFPQGSLKRDPVIVLTNDTEGYAIED